jgi:uncharacterized protein YxeA
MSAYIPTLGTILVAIFTAFFGVYSYQRQKRVDRDNYIAQKKTDREIELGNQRMKEYARYITAYQTNASLWDTDSKPERNSKQVRDAQTEYWVAYSNLFQIVSDPVVTATSDLHQLWWWSDWDSMVPEQREEQGNKVKSLYAKMIAAMRMDVSEQTNLSLQELEDRAPT